jgi:hypothetical protein
MKTFKILLMVLLAMFLTAVIVSAQDDGVPVSDPFALEDPFAPPAPPAPPGGGYAKSGGGNPNGLPPGQGGVPPGHGGIPPGQQKRVPEPSTLILLGIGLAAGGVYSFVRRQKSKERE